MMPVPEHALVYVATYESRDAAVADYETLARLYSRGAIHTYNATVLSGDLDGRLKIVTAKAPLRGRARIVLAAGALAGLFFPPCLLWDDPMSVAGGGGDTMKEFWRGLSRDDLRTIAKMLQHQAAAIIVISETTLHRVLKRSARGAFREFAKAVRAGDATFALDLPRAVDRWLGAA
jgi:hypothetical protein